MEFLSNVIFPALATIVTGLAGWGMAVLVNWLNSKIKNEKVRAALDNTRGIISAAVAETSQKFVANLKKTGNFTDAMKAEAYRQTLSCVKSQLTEEAKTLIESTTNDLNAWFEAEIEKAVWEGKKEG